MYMVGIEIIVKGNGCWLFKKFIFVIGLIINFNIFVLIFFLFLDVK